jgi:predicted outer membrane lipoprotein
MAATYLLAAVAFGIIMAKVIEFPILRVRDQLLP